MGKGISLERQALERLGKNWGKSSLTREKLLSGTKLFAGFVDKTFHLERLDNLKPGMITAYVATMKAGGLEPSTMAGRMTAVRAVCKAVGKQGICAKHNAAYGIERVRVNPQPINHDIIDKIRTELQDRAGAGDRIARMMTTAEALRQEFGLRAKESLMTKDLVEKNGKMYLVVEGSKGGKPRELEVRTEGQLKAVQLVAATSAALGSGTSRIIPPEMSLKQAYNAQRNEWRALGGTRLNNGNMHSERHGHARTMKAEGATNAQIMEELGHGECRSPAAYIPR